MSPASRWLAGVLLAVAIVVPLLVGVYDREDPTLFGFPFFFWFQFVLIPVASGATYAAFKLVTPTGRRQPRAGGEHR
jgi:nitrate/nitrite transporter NarK